MIFPAVAAALTDPSSAPSLFFWFPASAGDMASSIVERLISTGIIALVTAVLSSLITAKVLAARMGDMVNRVGTIEKQVVSNKEKLNGLELQRSNCELRAAQAFPTRSEIMRVQVETSTQFSRLMDEIDRVHGRITDVAKDVSVLKGRSEKGAPK